MSKQYVILLNGGIYHGERGVSVFSEQQVKEVLQKAWQDNEVNINDEEVNGVDELFEQLQDCPQDVYGLDGLAERGDDYVNIGVCELTF